MTADDIVERVAQVYHVTPQALRAKNRNSRLVDARRVAIYLMIDEGFGTTAIAHALNRHWTTIVYHARWWYGEPSDTTIDNLRALQAELARPLYAVQQKRGLSSRIPIHAPRET